MKETIENTLKEIERLNHIVEMLSNGNFLQLNGKSINLTELNEYMNAQQQEIERLNNIINELLKKIQFYKTTEWGLRGYGILENFENILNGGDVKSDR